MSNTFQDCPFTVSNWESILTACLLSFGFVLSLYLWRGATKMSRESKRQILNRIISNSIFSLIIAPLIVFYWRNWNISFKIYLSWHGIRSEHFFIAFFYPLILTMILYTGPLILTFLSYFLNSVSNHFSTNFISEITFLLFQQWKGYELTKLRDLFFGPINEEFVYRTLICIILISGDWGINTIFISSLLFGLSHLHHIIHHINTQGASFIQALQIVLFQLTYTTLFGSFVSYVFLCTGHLIAPIVCHIFLNIMGFPRLSFMVDKYDKLYSYRYIIFLFHVIGLVLFFYFFRVFIDSTIFDSPFTKFL